MAKLVLKYGEAMIEYDGPEAFLKDELERIVKTLGELRAVAPSAPRTENSSETPSLAADAATQSVSTLAQKLSANTGPDLLEAAALSLALAGSPAFTKQQLRARAREAKTFWKKSYGNNFDNYINRLVTNGRLNHVSGDNYALPDKQKTALQTKLAAVK